MDLVTFVCCGKCVLFKMFKMYCNYRGKHFGDQKVMFFVERFIILYPYSESQQPEFPLYMCALHMCIHGLMYCSHGLMYCSMPHVCSHASCTAARPHVCSHASRMQPCLMYCSHASRMQPCLMYAACLGCLCGEHCTVISGRGGVDVLD